jgi:ATPase subunit of ABC transporter with duplicated ATPase domains
MAALELFNGGVIVISHDERFITKVAKEVRIQFWRGGIDSIVGPSNFDP